MHLSKNEHHDRLWWQEENLKYSQPHYRLVKCARIANALSKGRECDLLDIGCGPATLSKLLNKNIHYVGIDLAIHDRFSNLMEMDLIENEINFQNMVFDLVVAQGFFEYAGDSQKKKFSEIKGILKSNGRFIATYVNFSHLHRQVYPMYNNIMPLNDFIRELSSFFRIERCFPTSHNWIGTAPRRAWLKKIQMRLDIEIPFVSRLLGVEYFFICAK
jgi:SAM-dependent methyltransferase